jgi:hypothetical protein
MKTSARAASKRAHPGRPDSVPTLARSSALSSALPARIAALSDAVVGLCGAVASVPHTRSMEPAGQDQNRHACRDR